MGYIKITRLGSYKEKLLAPLSSISPSTTSPSSPSSSTSSSSSSSKGTLCGSSKRADFRSNEVRLLEKFPVKKVHGVDLVLPPSAAGPLYSSFEDRLDSQRMKIRSTISHDDYNEEGFYNDDDNFEIASEMKVFASRPPYCLKKGNSRHMYHKQVAFSNEVEIVFYEADNNKKKELKQDETLCLLF